jgi:2,5-furandicarboxylate decarboxylase 1
MSQILDTRFRSALTRLIQGNRVLTYQKPIDPHLEIAAILKKLDGKQALLFPSVNGYDTPVIGNLLSSKENCEAAFGLDFNGIRGLVQRAMGNPRVPKIVTEGGVENRL